MNCRPIGIVLVLACAGIGFLALPGRTASNSTAQPASAQALPDSAAQKLNQGRHVFRFDTFGDQAFWGDALRLHQAIEGRKFGGVGPGVSPNTALDVGLKVDAAALPAALVQELKNGQVNLNDPAVTLALSK